MAEIDPAGQGPFHLLMADRDGALLVWSDLERLHRRALPPGIHVVTERSFDAAPTSREPLLARLRGRRREARPSRFVPHDSTKFIVNRSSPGDAIRSTMSSRDLL